MDKEGLNLLRVKIEEGDLVLVTRLDRLGSDTADMIKLIKEFDKAGIAIRFIKEGLSTEGTNASRLDAMANGVAFGRKRSVDRVKLPELHKCKMGATDIVKELGIGRSTAYLMDT